MTAQSADQVPDAALSGAAVADALGAARSICQAPQASISALCSGGIAAAMVAAHLCYRSTALLGRSTRFVLSTSGHIASMVNPPGNPKSTFQTGPGTDNPADPADWLRAAQTITGSWWPDYSAWLADRSGPRQERQGRLGNAGFPPLQAAPGSYVLDR